MAQNAQALFRATKSKPDHGLALMTDLPDQRGPVIKTRRAEDYYPTGEPEAIRGLFARDGDRIRECGAVWEPACGAGHMVRDIRKAGLPCCASDLVDRGCPDSWTADFFTCHHSRARAIITNPPYALINARDGAGRWLRHTLDMPGWDYLALLLSWDWPAARANGLGALLEERPFSYCYLMRWKLDFTGEGSPPQRNAWFVWDRNMQRAEPGFRWMNREDGNSLNQPALI